MPYFALVYDMVTTSSPARGVSDEHLHLARESYARGELVLPALSPIHRRARSSSLTLPMRLPPKFRAQRSIRKEWRREAMEGPSLDRGGGQRRTSRRAAESA